MCMELDSNTQVLPERQHSDEELETEHPMMLAGSDVAPPELVKGTWGPKGGQEGWCRKDLGLSLTLAILCS